MNRRKFLGGLIASPAIVRLEVLIPIRGLILSPSNDLLTINLITREAIRLFINSNAFIKNINDQYDFLCAQQNIKVGSQLRIRLPNGN